MGRQVCIRTGRRGGAHGMLQTIICCYCSNLSQTHRRWAAPLRALTLSLRAGHSPTYSLTRTHARPSSPVPLLFPRQTTRPATPHLLTQGTKYRAADRAGKEKIQH